MNSLGDVVDWSLLEKDESVVFEDPSDPRMSVPFSRLVARVSSVVLLWMTVPIIKRSYSGRVAIQSCRDDWNGRGIGF